MNEMNKAHDKPISKKKPYTKPRMVYKQKLEARASACTPIGVGYGKATTGGPFQPGYQCQNLFS
ncbi:MAG: hypothetical protein HY868_16070 [Chloroflexi bacterium]|nr:hypothetical protein [Chloroflexota bacterium]